ncbi:cell division protein ZipA C-terminal FtsZ-binding domain-containing protein [Tepidiphilus sp. J10]|uniref:cell division protein ZipA C-terminal FtsZ-binding domain-containing protein n=1 Tax=Tepidiphilus sp. J10 TaxID=2502185 RepID=UPI00115E896B|nr:cell division protein ZipA C-terminal FtsZ-binding domain-containing protein [Tepidiphilus sp. J10]
MDTDLLVALGGVLVIVTAGFFGYSKWQETRSRRTLERTLHTPSHDPLLDTRHDETPETSGEGGEGDLVLDPVRHAPARREYAAAPSVSRAPHHHPDGLKEGVDLMVRLESLGGMDAAALREVVLREFRDSPRPVGWYVFDDASNDWQPLTAKTEGQYHLALASLQLADRSGAIGEKDYLRFTGGVERVADQLGAVPGAIESRVTVLERAAALDRFCAEVDVQIAVNVVPRNAPIPGTKIRAAAEAAGLTLGEDGLYRLLDDHGVPLYALADLDGRPFRQPDIKLHQANGVTLFLEVTKIPSPVVFDRMFTFAEKLASTLDGQLVDDAGNPITPEAGRLIRERIAQIHQRMKAQEIPPGSSIARRVFAG